MLRLHSPFTAAAFALCFSGFAAGQTAGPGSFVGRVTDPTGSSLPGVRITVTGPGLHNEVIADEEGQFEIGGVLQPPPASYSLRAELSGFETTTISGIAAEPGSIVEINVRMRVGCLSDSPLEVMLPLPERFASAGVVALVRLDSSVHHRRVTLDDVCGPLTEFVGTVAEPIKNADQGRRLRFFLMPAKELAPQAGAEYVVLLQWRAASNMYRLPGQFSLVPVTYGSLRWEALGDAQLPNEVPLSEALEALRALAAQP